jgi:hypothetical protein
MRHARKIRLWLCGAAAAAAVGAWFAASAMGQYLNRGKASRAWAQFSGCLLGDQPLGAELPSERMRRIELGVMERKAGAAPTARDAGWPADCAPYGEKLADAWRNSLSGKEAVSHAQTVDPALRMMTGVLRGGKLPTEPDQRGSADQLWVWSTGLAAYGDELTGFAWSPDPASPFRTSDLTPVSRAQSVVEVGPIRSRSVHLRLRGPDEICTFSAGCDEKAFARAQCQLIAAAIANAASLRLVGLDDWAPPMLAVTDAQKGGVYNASTGELVVAASAPQGAWGKVDGLAATLDLAARRPQRGSALSEKYTFARRLLDGTIRRTDVDFPPFREGEVIEANIVGDQILWLRRGYDWPGNPVPGPRVAAEACSILDSESADMDRVIPLGGIPSEYRMGDRVMACRTPRAMFVELRDVKGRRLLLIREGGRWPLPVLVQQAEGELTCVGTQATYTWPRAAGPTDPNGPDKEGPLLVNQTLCTSEGCTTHGARLPAVTTRPADIQNGKVATTQVGGRVALVTVGDAVLLRVGTLAELPNAPARVLLDADPGKPGAVLVHSVRLFGQQDAALLLVHTSSGFYALRIDPTGKATAVQVQR